MSDTHLHGEHTIAFSDGVSARTSRDIMPDKWSIQPEPPPSGLSANIMDKLEIYEHLTGAPLALLDIA